MGWDEKYTLWLLILIWLLEFINNIWEIEHTLAK